MEIKGKSGELSNSFYLFSRQQCEGFENPLEKGKRNGDVIDGVICSQFRFGPKKKTSMGKWLRIVGIAGIKGKMGYVSVIGHEEKGKLGQLNWKAKKWEMGFCHEDREESGSTFNKGAEPNCGPNIVVGDETLSCEDPFTTTPQTTAATAARASSTSTPINTTNPSSIDLDPNPATANPVSVDPTTVDPNDIDVGELVRDDDEDYGSDVHEEVRELRAEKRTFQRRKRNERVQADTKEVPVSEAEPELGFDETETGKISVEGRLGGDEPYYPSFDADSFEIDEDECCDKDEHNSDADSYDFGWVNLPRKILAARHKTIITMLEEIRVKMMTMIGNLREFTNTWKCNFSPMALKVWQLKGIPCAHVMAAIYFKKCDHVDYIDSCYIAPSEIKNMPGRPGKLRRKEAGETKKSGKLPRTGLAMTCSNCNGIGHNKSGCPQNVQSSAREEPSGSGNGRGNTSSSGRGRQNIKFRQGKRQTKGEPPTKKGRGRPRKTPTAPPTPLTYPTLTASPLPTATSLPTTSKRGRPRKTPSAYLEHPAPPTSLPTTSKRGRGRGSEITIPYKISSIIGMGVFQAENGFKAFNILSTGATKVTRSADITGDIGFKPVLKASLNGKGNQQYQQENFKK
ncbi:hypothetical protein H5410_022538 [Solanum commersonii]|uniref:Zinc finger PMZ-type domain-containing protein n=1 Tax=Solanum commersonii TaxID=4109 RepID=A0A9J5ZEE7_SOLCO|nr:hypothetical protein H5410_022538 [Solanum commersonii]